MEEEFQVVQRGRRARAEPTGAHSLGDLFKVHQASKRALATAHIAAAAALRAVADEPVDDRRVNAVARAVARKRAALATVGAVTPVLTAVRTATTPVDVLCIGLGSPNTCPSATSQLAFLLLLDDFLAAKPGRGEMSIHEPLLSPCDRAIIEKVLPHAVICAANVEGKVPIRGPTVVFMPHCPGALYCHFLRANWDRLTDITLIGNSFRAYVERCTTASLKKRRACVLKVAPFTVEAPLPIDLPEAFDAFTDTAVHSFPPARLPPTGDPFWTDPPPYPPPDPDVVPAPR